MKPRAIDWQWDNESDSLLGIIDPDLDDTPPYTATRDDTGIWTAFLHGETILCRGSLCACIVACNCHFAIEASKDAPRTSSRHTLPPFHANGREAGVAEHGRTGFQVVAVFDQLDAVHPAYAHKAKANCAYFVHAANSHYGLLDALKSIRNESRCQCVAHCGDNSNCPIFVANNAIGQFELLDQF